jgi:hypothetical protein
VTLRLNRADLRTMAGAPEAISPAAAGGALDVRLDGKTLRASVVEVGDAPPDVVFHARYPRTGGHLSLRSVWLERLPFGHRQFARVEDAAGAVVAARMLSAAAPTVDAALGARPALAGGPVAFFTLGVAHILGGWDHLIFLVTLLVASRGPGAVVRTVSAFTVAHSLTLAAATLGWVRPSPALIEPAIAASIVAAAGLNLVARGRETGRFALTFGFGLIHGLGFAGALAGLGLGASPAALARSLLAFNCGVEAGQLGVTAVVLPLLWMLRRSPGYARYGVPGCSLATASVGVVWLLERALG